MTGCPIHHHGMSKARGCEHVAVSRFSKLFPKLKGLSLSEEEAAVLGGPGGIMHDFNGDSRDSAIPAGYIFFSQFIDHDITLDTTSRLHGEPLNPEEVAELPNIRSASLDLDCVYGFGPEASPQIYDPERPGRIAINANGYDLARAPGGTALIGDPRNDENIFVSQMQLLFERFHNKLYNERIYQEPNSEEFNRFEEAQTQTRYHYQWLVLFDFLKRLCDPDVYRWAVPQLLKMDGSYPLLHKPDECRELPMPVEFSVAAYRVGHTMVRSIYAVNDRNLDVELFDKRFGTEGFTSLPEELAVDWRYLLPVEDCVRPRMCKGIDPLLADELQNLPVVPSRNPDDRALAFRNLLRGNTMGLPSGQAVAKELKSRGYPVEAPFDLRLDEVAGWARLDALEPNGKSRLREDTPLFYYVLRESELKHESQRFGPLGSAILLEVFGGMLAHCTTSFLKEDPEWNPDPCVSKESFPWWPDKFKEGFSRKALVEDDGYYPFELADVARFVGPPRS